MSNPTTPTTPTTALRNLSSRQSVLERADGSAHYRQGLTEVVVGVYGPLKAKRVGGLEANLEVVLRPANGPHTPEEMRISQLLHTSLSHAIALSLNPRTDIRVVAQVIHDDGSLISAIINACSLALLDAGIPLRTLLVSLETLCLSDGSIIVDPTKSQEEQDDVVMSLTLQLDGHERIVAEEMFARTKDLSDDYYWTARNYSSKVVSKLLKFVRLTTTAKALYECHGAAF
eukprot:TRINITY_DN3736_c0_g1_i1.p1 TRINITY_DN3736_c0_g1~~TRINITY_DN3736_c0_g1_i1.p1  ORF type:complete len:257 (+),score=53.69 TRINITY_DN3736_c0_g1_i1:84-773(+)